MSEAGVTVQATRGRSPGPEPSGLLREDGPVFLNLEMAPEVAELLQELGRRVHGEEADAIRLGLGVLKIALDAWEKEGAIAVLDRDGRIEKRITGL